MKALIFENKVIQVEDKDFPVARTMFWMDAPEGCEYGWEYNPESKKIFKPEFTPTLDDYKRAVEVMLDDKAIEKQYENAASIVSYAASLDARWKKEATQFIAWRDALWQYAIEVYGKVERGEIPAPSIEQFKEDAPRLNWSN